MVGNDKGRLEHSNTVLAMAFRGGRVVLARLWRIQKLGGLRGCTIEVYRSRQVCVNVVGDLTCMFTEVGWQCCRLEEM